MGVGTSSDVDDVNDDSEPSAAVGSDPYLAEHPCPGRVEEPDPSGTFQSQGVSTTDSPPPHTHLGRSWACLGRS